LYRRAGPKFQIGSLYEDGKTSSLITIGRDITGEGVPNLVVSEYSGGAHCCLTVHVFELGETFREVAKLEVKDADLSDFEDLDGNGKLLFVTADFAFGYFPLTFLGSPAPQVILRYQDGKYRIAEDHMRQAPPREEELVVCAAKLKKDEAWVEAYPAHADLKLRGRPFPVEIPNHPTELWQLVVELIYSGNPESAWRFVDLVWPDSVPGKDHYLQDFTDRLYRSQYSSEVKELPRFDPARSSARVVDWTDRCERLFGPRSP
jgi:hypothetical protein